MFLDHITDPPRVIAFEVAYGNFFRAAGDRELFPVRTPSYFVRRPIDSKNDQFRLPFIFFIVVRPYERVTIVRTSNDLIGRLRPVHAADAHIVLRERERERVRKEKAISDPTKRERESRHTRVTRRRTSSNS